MTTSAPEALDPERCYRAVSSRDARFDGWIFVGVTSTGIYCRPSCPAVTPKRANTRFYRTAAAAQQSGFRACKRCRPDATPGSPEWNRRGDAVARAMRLIGDGAIDRDGVAGLADRLAFSERHLNRIITEELGVGPLAIARAQRAQTARILIETTTMPLTDVAFAAGFGSVRQFNDTIREVFASSPTELRSRRGARGVAVGEPLSMQLAVRAPFEPVSLLEFLGQRAVPGVESWDGAEYRRALHLPRGHGIAAVTATGGAVRARLQLADVRDLGPAVQRLRRLLDLDADPVAVDGVLGDDPLLGPLVAKTPGRRSPGAVDAAEIAVRAVLGQQVSVAGARTIAGRLAAAVGEPLTISDPVLTHVFPTSDAIAALDPALLPMPESRRRTVLTLAAALAAGRIVLDPGSDRDRARAELTTVPGIGTWTAGYITMRGLGDPDVMLETDLGVRHAATALGLGNRPGDIAAIAERWRPWRSYALHHLWSSL